MSEFKTRVKRPEFEGQMEHVERGFDLSTSDARMDAREGELICQASAAGTIRIENNAVQVLGRPIEGPPKTKAGRWS